MWFFKYEKNFPTFGMCEDPWKWVAILKSSMLDFLGYSINEFQELAPWFPLMIFTSRGVVLSGSNFFHELNAKCMHIFDQNFTQISMKIQGQIDHLKALQTSHAPPFFILMFLLWPTSIWNSQKIIFGLWLFIS
jgi:hypothetical protein